LLIWSKIEEYPQADQKKGINVNFFGIFFGYFLAKKQIEQGFDPQYKEKKTEKGYTCSQNIAFAIIMSCIALLSFVAWCATQALHQ
jgi:hypothetical protein